MQPSRLPQPLFGIVALADAGREHLDARNLHVHVRQWAESVDDEDWLIDRDSGIALFRPAGVFPSPEGRERSALLLRGQVRPAWQGGDHGLEQLNRQFELDAEGAVRSCRGDFQIVHWNGRARRLTIARDHLGRRSFFWKVGGPLAFFSSEPAPLYRSAENESVSVDRRSLFWFLAFGAPAPGRSLVQGVRQVRAAHLLTWTPGNPMLERRYWSPLSPNAKHVATAEALEDIEARLQLALVNDASTSDFALALSGGLDSSLLASLALEQGIAPQFAVNVRFEDGLADNEHDYAQFAAAYFGIPLEVVTLEAATALDLLDKVVGALPEPCTAWASLSQAAMLGRVRERGLDRLCSGYGADEIFGGYDHFRIAAGSAIRAGRAAGDTLGHDLYDWLALDTRRRAGRVYFPGVARFFDDAALRRLLLEPYRHWRHSVEQSRFYDEACQLRPGGEPIEMMVAHECQHRIPDTVLKSFNPLALRYGVGTAYPFLDPDLCQLAAGLRLVDRYRTPQGNFSLRRQDLLPAYKWALTRLAGPRLPEPLRTRERKSFTAPLALWMRLPRFRSKVIEMIEGSRLWDLGMVDARCLGEVLVGLEAGPGPNAHRLWCLLALSRWCDLYRAT